MQQERLQVDDLQLFKQHGESNGESRDESMPPDTHALPKVANCVHGFSLAKLRG
jgi:hypothetical protein